MGRGIAKIKAQKVVSFVPQYVLAVAGQLLYKGNAQLINKYNHSLTLNKQSITHDYYKKVSGIPSAISPHVKISMISLMSSLSLKCT